MSADLVARGRPRAGLVAGGRRAILAAHQKSGSSSGSTGADAGQAHPHRRTVAPPAALASYYTQKLTWSDCESGDLCATLTVPLDYRTRRTTIQLACSRCRPPARRAIGSLVINPGGPGEPGTSFAARAQAFGQPLLDHFDIVGFDPRGIGGSSPVDCLSDSAARTLPRRDPDPSTPAEVSAFRASQQALATGCSRLSGALASHISTVESARDMDILRAALGEQTLSYLGFSYGTKLGATYAQLFPQRVGRFVLDGAVDVSLSTRASTLQQAAGFQRRWSPTPRTAWPPPAAASSARPCPTSSTP